jgi:hypothetical protein
MLNSRSNITSILGSQTGNPYFGEYLNITLNFSSPLKIDAITIRMDGMIKSIMEKGNVLNALKSK